MPKLPFQNFAGAAQYYVREDAQGRNVHTLRYRFPEMSGYAKKTPKRDSYRLKKREFLRWARAFLTSGGCDPEEIEVEDVAIMAQIDETITIGQAVRLYLKACPTESPDRPHWLDGISEPTYETRQRPMLTAFVEQFGGNRPLRDVSSNDIFKFIRGRGGKKETGASIDSWRSRGLSQRRGRRPAVG